MLDRQVPVLPGPVTPAPVMRVRIEVPRAGPIRRAGNTASPRRFIRFELHPGYVAIARRRLATAVRFCDRGVAGTEPPWISDALQPLLSRTARSGR